MYIYIQYVCVCVCVYVCPMDSHSLFYCHLYIFPQESKAIYEHLRPVRIFAADQTGEALTRPRGVPPKEDAEQIETPQSYAHRIHVCHIW